MTYSACVESGGHLPGIGHPPRDCPTFGMAEPHACDRCGTVYDEAGGDGYCGLCPSCADATEPPESP